jgi:hypothetical protein
MFNYIEDKEKYISFKDNNYLDSYVDGRKSVTSEEKADVLRLIPEDCWYTHDKVEVYCNSEVEIVGAWFYNPHNFGVARYIGEYSDGSGIIEFRPKRAHDEDCNGDCSYDPILQWEGVITRPNGDEEIINYKSSRTLREGYGRLTTGNDFEEYDRCPRINKWLARSWIDNGEEELLFLVEDKQTLLDAADYYQLPIPYDEDLREKIDTEIESIRIKSVDMNHAGEGNFVGLVVASVVFENSIPTKLRLYKTSRWND